MLSNVARARLVTPANSWTVSVSTPRELLNLRSDTPQNDSDRSRNDVNDFDNKQSRGAHMKSINSSLGEPKTLPKNTLTRFTVSFIHQYSQPLSI